MGLAFVWSIVYIYLMSLFAEIIAWAIIGLTQIGFLGLTIGCFVYYGKSKNENAKKVALLVGIGAGLVTLLVALCLYCGWS